MNLNRAIEEQAKTLLGADLVINSREPFTPEEDELFKQIGGEQSREISFSGRKPCRSAPYSTKQASREGSTRVMRPL